MSNRFLSIVCMYFHFSIGEKRFVQRSWEIYRATGYRFVYQWFLPGWWLRWIIKRVLSTDDKKIKKKGEEEEGEEEGGGEEEGVEEGEKKKSVEK